MNMSSISIQESLYSNYSTSSNGSSSIGNSTGTSFNKRSHWKKNTSANIVPGNVHNTPGISINNDNGIYYDKKRRKYEDDEEEDDNMEENQNIIDIESNNPTIDEETEDNNEEERCSHHSFANSAKTSNGKNNNSHYINEQHFAYNSDTTSHFSEQEGMDNRRKKKKNFNNNNYDVMQKSSRTRALFLVCIAFVHCLFASGIGKLLLHLHYRSLCISNIITILSCSIYACELLFSIWKSIY